MDFQTDTFKTGEDKSVTITAIKPEALSIEVKDIRHFGSMARTMLFAWMKGEC